jgi:excisionase family DNA binding protein
MTRLKQTEPPATRQSTLLQRGRRLAHRLHKEGRQAEAETVTALLNAVQAAQNARPDTAWLTTGAVAKRVGVTRQTIVNWVKRGVIPGRRVGGRTLIHPNALADFAPLERLLDELDADSPPLAADEAAAAVASTRKGWAWQDPTA